MAPRNTLDAAPRLPNLRRVLSDFIAPQTADNRIKKQCHAPGVADPRKRAGDHDPGVTRKNPCDPLISRVGRRFVVETHRPG